MTKQQTQHLVLTPGHPRGAYQGQLGGCTVHLWLTKPIELALVWHPLNPQDRAIAIAFGAVLPTNRVTGTAGEVLKAAGRLERQARVPGLRRAVARAIAHYENGR